MNPWQVLGVVPDIAVADLRRRYAALIKEFRPETHPQDFARIREAYEIVLRQARLREAQAGPALAPAAEEVAAPAHAPAAAPEPEPAPAPEAPPPREYDRATDPEDIEIEALAASDAEDPPLDEPTLGELFHHFMAVAHPVTGSADEALRPMLRMLLRTRARASLDDSQALEFALLRWFLESEQPALTMLFETGHAFGWHEHPDRLAAWLSPPAMRRIEGLLALSRDLVFARHYSGNAWVRRLHRRRRGVVPLASRAATLEALGWAVRWRQLAGEHAPQLASSLDASTQQRLQGFGLWSTDVLTGLAWAALAPDLVTALVLAVVGCALACGLRLAARLVMFSPRTRVLHAPLARLVALGWKALLGAALALSPLALLLATTGRMALLAAIAVPVAGGVLLWLAWRLVGIAEVFASGLLGWRGAVDRLEFARMVQRRDALYPAAPPEQPYGERLSWRERLRAIGPARQLQARELLQGTRPPVPRVSFNFGNGDRPSWWRLAWIAFWLLFAVARGAHLFSN
jgi:hypothetical protein